MNNEDIGLPRTRARNIKEVNMILREGHDGLVPARRERRRSDVLPVDRRRLCGCELPEISLVERIVGESDCVLEFGCLIGRQVKGRGR